VIQPDALSSLLRRFRHGSAELWTTFRALRADRIAWRRYLRVCSVQALVTLAAAGVSVSTARQSSEDLREERIRKAVEQAAAVTSAGPGAAAPVRASRHPARPTSGSKPAPATGSTPAPPPTPAPELQPVRTAKKAPPPPPQDEEQDEDDDEDDAVEEAVQKALPAVLSARSAAAKVETPAELRTALEALQGGIAELTREGGATAVRKDKAYQRARKQLDAQLTALEHAAERIPLTPEDRTALIRAGAELDVLEQRTKPGFWDSALALIISIYGALSLVQAGVIALSRDYHAAIARDASLLLGVAPEDPPMVPRVRLNIAWVRRKLKQRTRSLMVFLPGLGLLTLAAMPFPHRATLTSALTAAWAAYWWVVWTASKSARAWEREGVARPPWFLRLWHKTVASLPLVGGLGRGMERIWSRLTRSVFSPAEAVEAQPVEFAGLAAARALQLIPVVKLYIRPLVPVAAARLMAERAPRAELVGSLEERATLIAQRAAAPISASAIRARDDT